MRLSRQELVGRVLISIIVYVQNWLPRARCLFNFSKLSFSQQRYCALKTSWWEPRKSFMVFDDVLRGDACLFLRYEIFPRNPLQSDWLFYSVPNMIIFVRPNSLFWERCWEDSKWVETSIIPFMCGSVLPLNFQKWLAWNFILQLYINTL